MSLTFATAAEVQTRAGRSFTSEETDTVNLLLESIADEALDAVSRDEDWYSALEDSDLTGKIQRTFKAVAIEAAHRVLVNPAGLDSTTETLGAYSYTQRQREEGGAQAVSGVYLTEAEGRRLRKAVFGKNTASAHIPTVIDEWYPVTESDILGD